MQFSKDPLINAIYQGIKRGIQVTFANECYGSFLILVYCGIDSMAYLDMPIDQEEVCRKDFIQWADQYLSPNLSDNITRITGEELYSARCAVVHSYTVESRKTKDGSARVIGYMVGGDLSIVWDREVTPSMVMLRFETLRDAFFTAIDKFLMEAYANAQKRPVLETRLRTLLNTIPY